MATGVGRGVSTGRGKQPVRHSPIRRNPLVTDSDDDGNLLLNQLKEHIVQIESLCVYTVLFIGVMALAASISSLRPYTIALACIFLAGTRSVFRVTNPTSSVRNRLTWSATLAGLGAGIGTAVGVFVDLASFGLTAGAGTAIGLTAGAAAGAAAGDRIEKWRNEDELMERGKAFAYLYARRHKHPSLSNPQQIEKTLDEMPKYDTNSDGHWKYTIEDLEREARKP